MKTHSVTFGHWQLKFELDGIRPLPISYSHRGFQLEGDPLPEIVEELYERALRFGIEQLEEV